MNSLPSSDLRYNLKSPPRAVWSPEENKKFEELIKEIPLDCPHIFEKIARELPSKSILDIKEHYGSLIEGVFIRHRPSFIEVPNYGNSEIDEIVEEIPNKKKKGKEIAPAVEEKPKKKRGMGDQWTEEEHEYVSKTFNNEYGSFLLHYHYCESVHIYNIHFFIET